jgi:hypothetical protein
MMTTKQDPLEQEQNTPITESDKPFFKETRLLFDYVSNHDFDNLAALCDDDFGIVDLGTEGQSMMIRNRAEWEAWFRGLFAQLGGMGATTYTDITGYDALETAEMGYSVVEFCQHLIFGGKHGYFNCVTTIIWKRTPSGWVESRWHCSQLTQRWEEVEG